MWIKTAVALLFAVASIDAYAAEAGNADGSNAPKSDVRRIARIRDIPAYLDKLNHTVQMAKSGDYGKIKKKDMERVEIAQSRIQSILQGRTDDSGLTDEDRLELLNQQETISAVIRDNDDSRIVCTRAPGTGSRLTEKECLTVGQRKARAEHAREATDEIRRNGGMGCVRDPTTGACM
jgi:hypothetical protein